MQSTGGLFLHERNPRFHASAEVENVVGYLRGKGEAIPNQPQAKISVYIGFLAQREWVNDGILTGDEESIDRQVDAHIIRSEDVPGSYFETQKRLAREQGMDEVEISPEERREAGRIIEADQGHSLRNWTEHLSKNESRYPDWFRFYTFQSVTRMGGFDAQRERFQKRTRSTIAPFPELNSRALSVVYAWIKEVKIDGEVVEGAFGDPQDQNFNAERETAFQKALSRGDFATLYAHAREAVQEERRRKGRWKKYPKKSDPKKLHNDLQGFGLDWCTATGYGTAALHLRGGDFYVYYSSDEKGRNRVPRVAVRMEQDEVAEVRGILPDQELEPELLDVAASRLETLPGGEAHRRKTEDMKHLTAIEKAVTANPDGLLSPESMGFLYEIRRPIEGFGSRPDPRIVEIRQLRGDRGKPEVAPMLAEGIHGQMPGAYVAYESLVKHLNRRRPLSIRGGERPLSLGEFEGMFCEKDKQWRESGLYEYLVEQLSGEGTRVRLVATPNVEADLGQIFTAAKRAFKSGRKMQMDDDFKKAYTSSEWSGPSGPLPVRFSLIPNYPDREISRKYTDEQVSLLRERQAQYPHLHLRVPSVLDAVAYWRTLKAQGEALKGDGTDAKTTIRHFDLRPTILEGKEWLPLSFMDEAGKLHLTFSLGRFETRLALG